MNPRETDLRKKLTYSLSNSRDFVRMFSSTVSDTCVCPKSLKKKARQKWGSPMPKVCASTGIWRISYYCTFASQWNKPAHNFTWTIIPEKSSCKNSNLMFSSSNEWPWHCIVDAASVFQSPSYFTFLYCIHISHCVVLFSNKATMFPGVMVFLHPLMWSVSTVFLSGAPDPCWLSCPLYILILLFVNNLIKIKLMTCRIKVQYCTILGRKQEEPKSYYDLKVMAILTDNLMLVM